MASIAKDAAASGSSSDPDTRSAGKKKEIYNYYSKNLVYGMGWTARKDHSFRLALGSFIEDYANQVEIIELVEDSATEDWKFKKVGAFDHPYPTTKIMWRPDIEGTAKDQVATTGDYLRLWNVSTNGITEAHVFNNNKDTEYCAPLTSFDWCDTDPSLIVTSSIDTTATVWDLETMRTKTQIIAHDKEAFDVAFRPQDPQIFATCGNDGSMRIFDRRDMEHSHIVYETDASAQGSVAGPLLRLGWNKQDPNYMATIRLHDSSTVVLDCRAPNIPVAVLDGHKGSVANALAWAPHSSCHICTAGDDSRAIIWDLSPLPKKIEDPILAYNASSEINQLMWSGTEPDWVSIACGKKVQILRV
eukprot:g5367.t1